MQYIGGYPRFVELGHNEAYLPVWLQEAGYNTYYTGKLMNGHSTSTYNKPRAAGWNQSDCMWKRKRRKKKSYEMTKRGGIVRKDADEKPI